MPESHQELFEQLAKELEARKKANEEKLGSALKVISENLKSESTLLIDQAQQADKRGDAETRDRLTALRKELSDQAKAGKESEEKRFLQEKAAIDKEHKANQDLAKAQESERVDLATAHAAESAALEKRFALDKENLEAKVEPPRPDFDPVKSALGYGVLAAGVAASFSNSPLPEMNQEHLEIAKDQAFAMVDHARAVGPEWVRENIPRTTGEIDRLAEEAIKKDKENPSEENKAWEEAQRTDQARFPSNRLAAASVDLTHEQNRANLDATKESVQREMLARQERQQRELETRQKQELEERLREMREKEGRGR